MYLLDNVRLGNNLMILTTAKVKTKATIGIITQKETMTKIDFTYSTLYAVRHTDHSSYCDLTCG